MKTIFEGEKRNIAVQVKRLAGATTYDLTTPQFRILDTNKVVITGFDWATATWDIPTTKILALFDTTAAALSTVGTYYMQLRAVITPTGGSAERYVAQVVVAVKDLGP